MNDANRENLMLKLILRMVAADTRDSFNDQNKLEPPPY